MPLSVAAFEGDSLAGVPQPTPSRDAGKPVSLEVSYGGPHPDGGSAYGPGSGAMAHELNRVAWATMKKGRLPYTWLSALLIFLGLFGFMNSFEYQHFCEGGGRQYVCAQSNMTPPSYIFLGVLTIGLYYGLRHIISVVRAEFGNKDGQ